MEAISSGSAMRRCGLSSSLARLWALIDSADSMAVLTGPGAIALTRIAGANSRAIALVNPMTPALAAQ